jgi:hypothetical protein
LVIDGRLGVGEVVVQALVDGVGDFPGITENRDFFARSTGFGVGLGGVGRAQPGQRLHGRRLGWADHP